MNGDASALDLFGTDEPVAERRILTAGPLSAILEGGNLRTICFAGVEAVRAINYLARDASWGTYKAELSNMRISEGDAAFEIGYEGLCAGPQGSFSYRMKIVGNASGLLTMEAEGVALTDFPTNRTGFVVLHPSEAAGGRLTIRHSDGEIVETTFPETISPDQPRRKNDRQPRMAAAGGRSPVREGMAECYRAPRRGSRRPGAQTPGPEFGSQGGREKSHCRCTPSRYERQ